MLEKFVSLLKMLFTIDEELKRLREESKRHGDRIHELASNQARLYYELQLQKEREAHTRETATLRLELEQTQKRLKELEAHLPPTIPKTETSEE